MNNRKLRLESLEERTLLAVVAGGIEQASDFAEPTEATTWVVNTLEDPAEWDTTDDVLSLREAIASASTGDTVVFDSELAGGTITLNGSQLEVTKGITIDATDIGGITIDADEQSRVFYIGVDDETDMVQLIGLTITGGWVDGVGAGGGIFIDESPITMSLHDTTVVRNTAYDGGGIINCGAILTITDSIITENDVNGSGGGIFNFGILTVTSSTIRENVAISEGGGIFNSGILTLTDSTVSENTNEGISNHQQLTLTDCFVIKNIGCGIDNRTTSTITCSVIAGNTEYGIDNSSNCTLTNTTVAKNNGGIYDSGTLTLTNSIVSLNGATDGYNIVHRTPISGSNNIIGLDPGFVNADALDFSLTSESVAIDCGTNDAVKTETDIDGYPRIVASWRETLTVDIGAYEYQETVTRGEIENPSTIVTTVQDVVDETDGLISLREAILYAAPGDTVTFDSSIFSQTIVLGDAELTIDKNLTIDATSIGGIVIDANGKSRIFYIGSTSSRLIVALAGIEIHNGSGIYNYSNSSLTLTNIAITGNSTGIYNASGTLTFTNSTIAGNISYALSSSGGTVTFYNSIITGSVSASSTRTYAYNTLSRDFTNWIRSENCLTYDSSKPLFADPAHGDYSLSENSQAINVGNNDYVSTETDLAGNPRILNGIVDLGAYEYTGLIEPLDAPSILTGSGGYYVSYGANRHQIQWSAVDRAAAYEFSYSEDGGLTWTTLETNDTSTVVSGLTYGGEVSYRVRALSTRYIENSDWSAEQTFNVCPMDINGDGDISAVDRAILLKSWLASSGDERYIPAADIDGDGDISTRDRSALSINWLLEADDDGLFYPKPIAADFVFSEYESADLTTDLTVF